MSLVDDHPLVQAADGKLADLERRRAAFEANVAPLAAEDEAAEQAYQKAVDAALLEGAPMPEPPVRKIPPGRDVEIRHAFLHEQQQLNEERLQAVAAAFPDVLKQARTRAKKLAAAAQAPLQELLTVMTEVGTLQMAVKACRDTANAEARNRGDGTSRVEFNDFPWTVEEFVRIVATAGDPIDLVDLGGRREIRTRAGITLGDHTRMTSGALQQLIGAGQNVRS
jgi:hypothetical protein